MLTFQTSVVVPGLNTYKINVQIGTPPQNFSFLYDLGSIETVVAGVNCTNCINRNLFNETNSSTFTNYQSRHTIDYIISKIQGNFAKDSFSLANFSTILNFVVFDSFTNNFGVNFDGILGMEHNYRKFGYNSSILEQLFSKTVISKKIITQKILNVTNGLLIIGDTPDEISNNIENYSTCSLSSSTDVKWNCALQSIFLGNQSSNILSLVNSSQTYQTTFFSTINNFILANNSTLGYFSQTYFGNNTKNGLCNIYNYSGYLVFMCNKTGFNLSYFQDVNFVLDGYGYKVYARDLFVEISSPNQIQFLIYFSPNNTEWIIGQPMLKNYQVVFDGEMDQIGFYGGPVVNLKTTSWFWIFGIILVILILFACIISMCYCCRKRIEHSDYGRQI